MQKRILFLGASQSQIAPIIYAKEQGHYVITCDYLPENPGHKLANEYHDISTTDKEAVLALAKRLNIDGIVAYASDPAAPTQAYVANYLGLPSNPYSSVLILSRKDLFKNFLKEHNFCVPESKAFYGYTEAKEWLDFVALPVIVKPVDSSGSKGVTQIKAKDELKSAFEYAMKYSKEKKVIVEEFFVKSGYQIGGDSFLVDGKVVFASYTNTHFDKNCNPMVPVGGSLPSVYEKPFLDKFHKELQRLMTLLKMKTGAINHEFQFDQNNNITIIEAGARNGGNLIPELVYHATGVNMVKYTVDAALGKDISSLKMKKPEGFYAYYVLHALQDGIVKDICFSDEIRKNIIQESIYIKKGDKVKQFRGSDCTLGIFIMKFRSEQEMIEKMDHMNAHIQVEIKGVDTFDL
ncbi:ATP-grasp domain-containing protein [Sulfurimonas sp. HSL3-7]|uniref:ATP-grasp domain-containing protein n=1 Tax=Sulfonitrofixus jiaomeiensis TaxID=3131938 RepID=UPI0031F82A2F